MAPGNASPAQTANDACLHQGIRVVENLKGQFVGFFPVESFERLSGDAPGRKTAVQQGVTNQIEKLVSRGAGEKHEAEGGSLLLVVEVAHQPNAILEPGKGTGHV